MGLLSYFKREPQQSASGRKQYEHRATFVPVWTNLPDSVRDEYEAGETLFKLSLKYRVSNNTIRQKLEALGVKIRPKSCHGPNNNHARKLDAEKIAWILKQDSQDVSHAEIARQIGNITRERIRQICLANGCATRRSRQTKALAIKEMREARKAEYHKMVMAASEAWKKGASLLEMSALLGDPRIIPSINHGNSRVGWLRRKYPDLFPRRRPCHWRALGLTDEQRKERMTAISEDWIAGLSLAEIAQRHGYKNQHSAAQGIAHFRKNHRELFPRRSPWIMRRRNAAARKASSVPSTPENQPNHL